MSKYLQNELAAALIKSNKANAGETWFIIETQYLENYADEGCDPHWKPKGGFTYHIYADNADAAVADWTERSGNAPNNFTQEFVIECRQGHGDPHATTDYEKECTDDGYCWAEVNRKYLLDDHEYVLRKKVRDEYTKEPTRTDIYLGTKLTGRDKEIFQDEYKKLDFKYAVDGFDRLHREYESTLEVFGAGTALHDMVRIVEAMQRMHEKYGVEFVDYYHELREQRKTKETK